MGNKSIVLRYFQQRTLLLTTIPLALLFVLTAALAGAYHAREEALTQEWFRKGNADLAAGRSREAYEDFRNSLSYDPENRLVQLRLAEALLADGQFSAARSYLLTLWERTPGSGEVNLDLAQVSIQTEDYDDAVRYFRASIFGSWDKDPAEHRRAARLELSKFLIGQAMMADAQTELGALAAEISPGDAPMLEQTGQLFLKAGQPKLALGEFESALRVNPQDARLHEEAGQAAFAAGEYRRSIEFLQRAVREAPSEQSQELIEEARDILSGDPYEAGLSNEEQAKRAWRAFQQGLSRLRQCSGSGIPLSSSEPYAPNGSLLAQQAAELAKRVDLYSLSRRPDLRIQAMQLVFQIEGLAAASCGKPAGFDRALVLIEKLHQSPAQ